MEYRFFLLLFFSTISFFVRAHSNNVNGAVHSVEIQSNQHEIEYARRIDELFAAPRILTQITCQSDKIIYQEEFAYLIAMRQGQVVTAHDVKKAIAFLFHKKTVSALTIFVTYPVQGAVCIHIECKGIWTLRSFKMGGIFSADRAYHDYYLISPGDEFDHLKHSLSLDRIVHACTMNGYFDATIDATFAYNKPEKSVTVTAQLNKGRRFSIGSVDLFIGESDCISPEEIEVLKQRLASVCARDLLKKPYEKELIKKVASTIKELLEEYGFLHTSIVLDEIIDRARASIDCVWRIELHHKKTFSFFGNSFFSSSQLLRMVMQFGKSAWLLPACIVAEEIERAYKDKGFWHVTIECQENADGYLFVINEGVQASITAVKLKNISHMSERALIKKCFSSILKRRGFSQDAVQRSVESMLALYRKRGFLKAKVAQHEYVENEQKNTYTLVVDMAEGDIYYVDSITIIDPFNDDMCQKQFDLVFQKNDLSIFDAELLAVQSAWLTNYYKKKGYYDVACRPEVVENAPHVVITWHVQFSTQPVYFGKSILLGNSSLPFSYICNELQYRHGELWDFEKMHQSFLRLKELQIFDAVHIYPDTTTDENGYKNLFIKLVHDDPYELRLRGGFELQHVQSYRTFSGISYKIGGAFIAKNPTNSADCARIDADFARSHRELAGKYWRPSFFNIPMRTLFQVYSIEHDQPAVANVNDIYTATQNGFLCGLSRKKNNLNGNINIGCEWMKTYIQTSIASKYSSMVRLAHAINFAPHLLNKVIPFFFIEPTLFIDRLDNKLDPHSGTLTVVSLKGMFPFHNNDSSYSFIKGLLDQSIFLPLRGAVIAARFRFGHIFHRRFNTIMPIERFYLGGSQSLRGYDTDLAPPLGVYTDADCKELIVPRGGKSMLNASIEARVPVIYNLVGVLFHDMGMLSGDHFADFRANNLLQSTGFGVRYLTPVGPLRFDIGFRWADCGMVHRNYAWFLTFGNAF